MTCYVPILSFGLFAETGDCQDINHDFKVIGGDFAQSDDVVSAILIQLNSDALSDGERGFWGDEFIGFSIGNLIWTLQGKSSIGVGAKVDQYIRLALQPIIEQGLIRDFTTSVVKTVGGHEVEILIIKSDGKELRVSNGI